ncbi:annulin-like isoform X2 [Cimex lectularius]|uniref:Transglutaminase N-terminal domain-containing protein n=1 Tax=Cimex lectularius TaxID=79782 RepID=A0A8I6S8X9_CIMLE|nr:annulin-like isoform X2 [Cimex lectularius]
MITCHLMVMNQMYPSMSSQSRKLKLKDESKSEEEIPMLIEYMDYNVEWNGKTHKTHFYHYYSNDSLVVRRGQLFKITFITTKPLPEGDYFTILLEFQNCSNPDFGNGTKALVRVYPLNQKRPPAHGNWSAYHGEISSETNQSITIDIIPHIHCMLGSWKMSFYNKNVNMHICKTPIYVIFNPWLEYGDEIPLEENQLVEYLIKDVGDIILGKPDKPKLEFWKYSQYENNVLPAVFSMLYDNGQLKYLDAGNIVNITRALIKAIMNPMVDEYKWGHIKEKLTLAGSKSLIEAYQRNKIVDTKKYFLGEVGLMVTAFRALGIPARVVTGFGVVRRLVNDCSFACNKYYTTDHRTIHDIYEELWYLRPWIEVFIPRKDICEEYCEWQWVCEYGPVSRDALRRRHLERPFGTLYAYNSLYSGVLQWEYDERDPQKHKKLVDYDNSVLHKRIFTKGTHPRTVCDLTQSYTIIKESEPKIHKILKTTKSVGDYIANSHNDDLEVDFQYEDEVLIGNTIKFLMILKNKSEINNLFLNYILVFESIYLNGKLHKIIHNSEDNCMLKKKTMECREIEFKSERYIDKIEPEYGLCKVCLQVRAKRINFTYITEKYITVKQPPLLMTILKDEMNQDSHFVHIELTNSLDKDIIDSNLILQEIDTNNKIILKIQKIAGLGKFIADVELGNKVNVGTFYFVVKFLSEVINCKVFGQLELKEEETKCES